MTRKHEEERVTIYTDGACDPNPGPGGWAAILMYKARRKELSGGEWRTTNNRMEMTAAIEALETLTRPCSVVLYTDSEYLQKGVTQWMPGWKRRGWHRKGGNIKNLDLWQQLDALLLTHDVEWRWVPGHNGHVHNERCDALATQAIEDLKKTKAPARR